MMIRFWSVLTILAVSTLSYNVSFAEETERMSLPSFQSAMGDLNRIKPLQNPRYSQAQDILNRHVVDSQNKVVGDLHDVLISQDRTIDSLLVSFDRLRLGEEVFLNYEALDIVSTSNGYKLNLKATELEQLYPELLANIETAAGQNDVVSVSSLLGRPVKNDKGHKIAVIENVLFENVGEYESREKKNLYTVGAVYINVTYRNIRGEGVAIPYDALTFEHDRQGRVTAKIDQDLSDAILTFVR